MQLPATVTLEQAAALAREIEADVARGSGTFTLDASALQTFDTSALAVLLQARRVAQGAGRGFALAGAPDKLAQLARLYGVAELLSLEGIVPSAAEAALAAAAARPAFAPPGSSSAA